jgi:hypothetical protein
MVALRAQLSREYGDSDTMKIPAYETEQYVILTWDSETGLMVDLGEGPFDTFDNAREFARNEVGAPWVVACIKSNEGLRDSMQQFRTGDGYTFTRAISGSPSMWTDGDMEFHADVDGWPVDDMGERLDGEFILSAADMHALIDAIVERLKARGIESYREMDYLTMGDPLAKCTTYDLRHGVWTKLTHDHGEVIGTDHPFYPFVSIDSTVEWIAEGLV